MGSNAQTQLRSVPMTERVTTTDVRLTLPARPENVSVIRHGVGAFAEALRLSDDLVEDLRLAVTEACTNVVRHAYSPEVPGPVEVTIVPSDEHVNVIVADHGRHCPPLRRRPRPRSRPPPAPRRPAPPPAADRSDRRRGRARARSRWR